MNKLLFALAVWAFSPMALAEVAGIYISANDPSLIVTVHQNGNTLVLLQHTPVMTYGEIGVDVGDGQYAQTAAIYSLTYLIGQLSADGKNSTAMGTAAAGACSATYSLQFSDAGLRMNLQGMYQAFTGVQQGIDCIALSTKLKENQQSAGGAPLLVRVF